MNSNARSVTVSVGLLIKSKADAPTMRRHASIQMKPYHCQRKASFREWHKKKDRATLTSCPVELCLPLRYGSQTKMETESVKHCWSNKVRQPKLNLKLNLSPDFTAAASTLTGWLLFVATCPAVKTCWVTNGFANEEPGNRHIRRRRHNGDEKQSVSKSPT